MHAPIRSTSLLGLATLLGMAACGHPTTPRAGDDPPATSEFDSDDPSSSAGAPRGTDGSASDAGTTASPTANPGTDEAAARAIEEADIIQVRGTRLYALSRYGGLSIVDVSVRDHLRLLGRRRMDAVPFEMYVRDGVVYAMLNDFGHSERDAATGAYRWVQSSRITALDVNNPAAIREIASYDVPGEVSDSRIVGNVLYLVAYENGYCWNCATRPSTTVASFAVGDPAHITRVDQTRFTAPNNSYSWWKRSVTATAQRLYIAGPSWNWDGNSAPQSVVQVLDISDPSGRLVRGADVTVDGQISSRWQMDEYAGVLRVVSQPGNGWWANGRNPTVQTFRITSSQNIAPLGRGEIQLPRPESLRSVRFDGARGYAITAQQTDPLFTLDLSDPANPHQVGALEIPGWVYHMEPRGDRLVGLGYDNQNATGALHVSLFDVSDLAHPRMIQRVNFGQGWASLAEDQDRIHKSFQVLDDLGMILVPFESYGRWDGTACSAPTSGIQLIDYGHDALTLRGIAPQRGMPRRAFVHDARLFAVSDRDVSTFRIDDRSAPARTAQLELSSPAHAVATDGTRIYALAHDWWSGEPTLAVHARDGVDDGTPLGTLSLRALVGNSSACDYASWSSWYGAQLFARAGFVYVVAPPSNAYAYYDGPAAAPHRVETIVGVIDARDPAHPRIAGRLSVPALNGNTTSSGYYYGGYGVGVLSAGSNVVQSGTSLAILETARVSTDWRDPTVTRAVRVLDLADPARPTLRATIDLGRSLGSTPLQLAGTVAMTSRWNPIEGSTGRVRFWVDRIDLADAPAPRRLTPIQTPGSLLTVDGARMVTVDYRRESRAATDWSDCTRTAGSWAYFASESGTCSVVRRSLKLLDVAGDRATLRQTLALGEQNLASVVLGDDRIAIATYPDYGSYGGVSSDAPSASVLLYTGIRAGALALASRIPLEGYGSVVAARGTRVATSGEGGLSVYETRDVRAPRLAGRAPLRGYGYASSVLLESDRAVCALGVGVLQSVALQCCGPCGGVHARSPRPSRRLARRGRRVGRATTRV